MEAATRHSEIADRTLRAFEEAARRADELFGDGTDLGVACAALLRSQRLLIARLTEILAPVDLSPVQMDVLGALVLAPDQQLTGVALRQKTFINSATVSHTLANLERRHLIIRQVDPANRRVVLISLTPAGYALVAAASVALNAARAGLPEFSDEDARALVALLSRLGAAD